METSITSAEHVYEVINPYEDPTSGDLDIALLESPGADSDQYCHYYVLEASPSNPELLDQGSLDGVNSSTKCKPKWLAEMESSTCTEYESVSETESSVYEEVAGVAGAGGGGVENKGYEKLLDTVWVHRYTELQTRTKSTSESQSGQAQGSSTKSGRDATENSGSSSSRSSSRDRKCHGSPSKSPKKTSSASPKSSPTGKRRRSFTSSLSLSCLSSRSKTPENDLEDYSDNTYEEINEC